MFNLKTIPLVSLSFISLGLIGIAMVNITNDSSIIFNPKLRVSNLVLLVTAIILAISTSGLLSSLNNIIKDIAIFSSTAYLGYILGTFNMWQHTTLSIMVIHYILVFIGFITANIYIHHEIGNNIKIKSGKIIAKSFKNFLLLLAVASTVLFYSSNQDIDLSDILTEKNLSFLVSSSEKLIEKQTNEQINNEVQKELSTLHIDLKSHVQQILPSVNSSIIASLKTQYGNDLDITNIHTEYNETTGMFEVKGIKTIIGQMLETTITKYAQPYEKYLPIVSTILFYLSLIWLFGITRIFIRPTIFLLQHVLLSLGYIKKETKTIEVERLSL